MPLGLGCSTQLGERLKYGGDCPLLQPVIPTDSHQLKAVFLEVFGAEVDVLRGRIPQALAAGVQPLTVGQPQAAPGVVFLGKSVEGDAAVASLARIPCAAAGGGAVSRHGLAIAAPPKSRDGWIDAEVGSRDTPSPVARAPKGRDRKRSWRGGPPDVGSEGWRSSLPS